MKFVLKKKRRTYHYTTLAPTKKTNLTKKQKGITDEKCPKCKKGNLLKGNSAYGCSNFKNGCDFVLPFSFKNKKISENQYIRLLQKGCTVNLKGFETEHGSVEGLVRFDDDFKLVLEPKKSVSKQKDTNEITCPKCKKGHIIKGNSAYGCSDYKNGCDFRFPFELIREKAKGKPLSKDLVIAILNGKNEI